MRTQIVNGPENQEEYESPTIRRVEMFEVDGKLFPSFEQAIAARENAAEALFQPVFNQCGTISPREKMMLLTWIFKNRQAIRNILNY